MKLALMLLRKGHLLRFTIFEGQVAMPLTPASLLTAISSQLSRCIT